MGVALASWILGSLPFPGRHRHHLHLPHIGHQVYFNGLPAGLGRRKEEEKACHRAKDNAVAEEGQSKGRGPSVLESTHGTTSLLILTGLGLCSNSHLADAYRFQLVKHKYKISMF